MKSSLQATALALAVSMAVGAGPAIAQDNGPGHHERGERPPPPQGSQRAPEAQQQGPRGPAGGPPRQDWQAHQGWQGHQGGPGRQDWRGPQGGQGRPDGQDRQGWQGHQGWQQGQGRPGSNAQAQYRDRRGNPNPGQFRGDQARAQWQADHAGQYGGGRYDRNQDRAGYDRRYDQGRYGGGGYGRDNRGGYQAQRDWNRGWHGDRRYDWNAYRYRNRDAFRLGSYYAPYRGYSYRRIGIGFSLQPLFFGNRYWIGDPFAYRLPPAYGPYRWVRYYDDALLVNIYTGEVVDTVYDIFW